ncbi:MAG: translation elongation factor Ts [bacterium]
MSQITAQLVQELRRRTGAGMMACKSVLTGTDGDIDRAVEVLRKQGIAKAESRESRTTGEGTIGFYVHHNGKIAAMVELNCETDFVARTDEFRMLARLLAEQVAATDPIAVESTGVPLSVMADRRGAYERQVRASGKAEALVPQIVSGKIDAYLREVVLLQQSWIREPKRVVADLVADATAQLGERIVVKRFVRFAVGAESGSRDV